MIQAYLSAKAALSRLLAMFDGPKRSKLPVFTSARELAAYMDQNFKYVPDPPGLDFYTHPGRTQYEIDARTYAYPCDCDDYAAYAYAALLRLPNHIPEIITILDGWISWSHVVCVFRDPAGQSWCLDTNGLAPLPQGPTVQAARELTQRRYTKAHYIGAESTEYPF